MCSEWVPVRLWPANDAIDDASAKLSPRERALRIPHEVLGKADHRERLALLYPQMLDSVYSRYVTDHDLEPWAMQGSKKLLVKQYCHIPPDYPESGQRLTLAYVSPTEKSRYYMGEPGQEELFLDVKRDDGVNYTLGFWEGPFHNERIVRRVFQTGQTNYYKGENGTERRVRTELASGTICYYKGPRHQERLVRKVNKEFTIEYARINGQDVAVRHVTADGDTITNFRHRGHSGRIVYVANVSSGTREVFEGEPNKERLVMRYEPKPMPNIVTFKGSCKHERTVRRDLLQTIDTDLSFVEAEMLRVPDPPPLLLRREFFEGPKGFARLVKVEHWDKGVLVSEEHYKGPPGEARLVCRHDPQANETAYFTGKRSEEVLYKSEDSEGNVVFYDPDGRVIDEELAPDYLRAVMRNKHKPKRASRRAPVDPEAARRAAVRKRWRSAAWGARGLLRAAAEATRANAEAAARHRAVREQCDAAKAARPERAYTASGPSHREGAPTWVAGDAPDARDAAKRAAEKDASRAAAAEAKAARRAAIARSMREYLEKARLLRVAEAIGGSK